MRTLNVVLDDDTSKVLAKYPNQSETVREALRLYDGHVLTDTKAGIVTMLAAVKHDIIENRQRSIDTSDRLVELYELVESIKGTLESFRQ